MEKRIDELEMWLYRRLVKIPWTEKRTNASILNELDKKLTLESKIRKQYAKFFGHAMRRQGLENLIITARVLGKRSQGSLRAGGSPPVESAHRRPNPCSEPRAIPSLEETSH